MCPKFNMLVIPEHYYFYFKTPSMDAHIMTIIWHLVKQIEVSTSHETKTVYVLTGC